MSGYRDDYDRTYPRRDDRARSLRPQKLSRDRNEERYGDRSHLLRAEINGGAPTMGFGHVRI